MQDFEDGRPPEDENMLKRRSSILKLRRLTSEDEEETNVEAVLTKSTRRVSFAASNFIKPFVADSDENTIWDNTYEEQVVNETDSVQASVENSKVPEQINSSLVGENELVSSVRTTGFDIKIWTNDTESVEHGVQTCEQTCKNRTTEKVKRIFDDAVDKENIKPDACTSCSFNVGNKQETVEYVSVSEHAKIKHFSDYNKTVYCSDMQITQMCASEEVIERVVQNINFSCSSKNSSRISSETGLQKDIMERTSHEVRRKEPPKEFQGRSVVQPNSSRTEQMDSSNMETTRNLNSLLQTRNNKVDDDMEFTCHLQSDGGVPLENTDLDVSKRKDEQSMELTCYPQLLNETTLPTGKFSLLRFIKNKTEENPKSSLKNLRNSCKSVAQNCNETQKLTEDMEMTCNFQPCIANKNRVNDDMELTCHLQSDNVGGVPIENTDFDVSKRKNGQSMELTCYSQPSNETTLPTGKFSLLRYIKNKTEENPKSILTNSSNSCKSVAQNCNETQKITEDMEMTCNFQPCITNKKDCPANNTTSSNTRQVNDLKSNLTENGNVKKGVNDTDYGENMEIAQHLNALMFSQRLNELNLSPMMLEYKDDLDLPKSVGALEISCEVHSGGGTQGINESNMEITHNLQNVHGDIPKNMADKNVNSTEKSGADNKGFPYVLQPQKLTYDHGEVPNVKNNNFNETLKIDEDMEITCNFQPHVIKKDCFVNGTTPSTSRPIKDLTNNITEIGKVIPSAKRGVNDTVYEGNMEITQNFNTLMPCRKYCSQTVYESNLSPMFLKYKDDLEVSKSVGALEFSCAMQSGGRSQVATASNKEITCNLGNSACILQHQKFGVPNTKNKNSNVTQKMPEDMEMTCNIQPFTTNKTDCLDNKVTPSPGKLTSNELESLERAKTEEGNVAPLIIKGVNDTVYEGNMEITQNLKALTTYRKDCFQRNSKVQPKDGLEHTKSRDALESSLSVQSIGVEELINVSNMEFTCNPQNLMVDIAKDDVIEKYDYENSTLRCKQKSNDVSNMEFTCILQPQKLTKDNAEVPNKNSQSLISFIKSNRSSKNEYINECINKGINDMKLTCNLQLSMVADTSLNHVDSSNVEICKNYISGTDVLPRVQKNFEDEKISNSLAFAEPRKKEKSPIKFENDCKARDTTHTYIVRKIEPGGIQKISESSEQNIGVSFQEFKDNRNISNFNHDILHNSSNLVKISDVSTNKSNDVSSFEKMCYISQNNDVEMLSVYDKDEEPEGVKHLGSSIQTGYPHHLNVGTPTDPQTSRKRNLQPNINLSTHGLENVNVCTDMTPKKVDNPIDSPFHKKLRTQQYEIGIKYYTTPNMGASGILPQNHSLNIGASEAIIKQNESSVIQQCNKSSETVEVTPSKQEPNIEINLLCDEIEKIDEEAATSLKVPAELQLVMTENSDEIIKQPQISNCGINVNMGVDEVASEHLQQTRPLSKKSLSPKSAGDVVGNVEFTTSENLPPERQHMDFHQGTKTPLKQFEEQKLLSTENHDHKELRSEISEENIKSHTIHDRTVVGGKLVQNDSFSGKSLHYKSMTSGSYSLDNAIINKPESEVDHKLDDNRDSTKIADCIPCETNPRNVVNHHMEEDKIDFPTPPIINKHSENKVICTVKGTNKKPKELVSGVSTTLNKNISNVAGKTFQVFQDDECRSDVAVILNESIPQCRSRDDSIAHDCETSVQHYKLKQPTNVQKGNNSTDFDIGVPSFHMNLSNTFVEDTAHFLHMNFTKSRPNSFSFMADKCDQLTQNVDQINLQHTMNEKMSTKNVTYTLRNQTKQNLASPQNSINRTIPTNNLTYSIAGKIINDTRNSYPAIPQHSLNENTYLVGVKVTNDDSQADINISQESFLVDLMDLPDNALDSDSLKSILNYSNVVESLFILQFIDSTAYATKFRENMKIIEKDLRLLENIMKHFTLAPINVPDLYRRKELEESFSTDSSIKNENEECPQLPIMSHVMEKKVKPLYDRICEASERCKNYWNLENISEGKYYFSTLFGTLRFTVELKKGTEIVAGIIILENIGHVKPIALFVFQLFKDKFSDKHLTSVLGFKYDILALLDYIHMSMTELMLVYAEFRSLCLEYGVQMDPEFRVSFKILNIDLIISCIVTVNMKNMNCITSNDISVISKYDNPFDNKTIESIVSSCPKGFSFLKNFIVKINEYISYKERRFKKI